jgi:pSer/pThr/pTyr-binding forkhead associated (FHA) protein
MKVACSNCGAQHSLPDAQLVGRPRVQFNCAKCGKTTLVEVAQNPDATQVLSPLPDFARSAGAPRLARGGAVEDAGLRLPAGKAIALSVISGPAKGLVHSVQKPRVVMGRADADIIINDKEISRWHCALEIKDDVIRLRDLESTNGTFFEDERVRVAELKHLSEFRIGTSVILLSVTPKLAVSR